MTLPLSVYLCVGWVGVGWQRRCQTRQSLRELDNEGTVSLFLAVAVAGGRVRSFVRGGELNSARGELLYRVVFICKAPTRQLHSIPVAVAGIGHTRNQFNSVDAVVRMQENPPQKRVFVGCSSRFMRLAQHVTALRAWCKQCLPAR